MFMANLTVEYLLYAIPAIVIGMTIHEFSHGYVSYKLGDDTPLEQGRLSLNPFHHIDPWGLLALLLFGFGWAKPVRVNPYHYRNGKSGMMWTAVAGPLSNFIIAFISVFLYFFIIKVNGIYASDVSISLMRFFSISANINIGMGIFNLLPIPPLDGSKILLGILDEETYFKFLNYEYIISIALVLVLATGAFDGILGNARGIFLDAFTNISMMLLGI